MTRLNSGARRGLLVLATLLASFIPLAAQQPPGRVGFATPGEKAQAPDPKWVVGDPAGPPLSGAELDAETKRVAALLRCPVCQGLSVYDSPASMAQNMKQQTRDLLAMGYSGDQVLNYFEKAYGEFVRLEPPLRGENWIVWLAPGLVLLGGAIFVVYSIRRMARKPSGAAAVEKIASDLPGRDTLPEDQGLATYVLRARELAYGWPGGQSPASAAKAGSEEAK